MTGEAVIKLVGIYGSPREGGNSDALLDAAIEGATDAGAAVERIYLRKLSFVPCEHCGFCHREGVCRLKDGMVTVYDALDNSAVVLLAAPIYFCSLCAQAKAMIDRCQPYWARKYVLKTNEQPKPGRTGGFICCGGFRDDRFLACTEQIVKTWYFILRINYQGHYFVPGLDALGDALRHPTARAGAVDYGRNLVKKRRETAAQEGA